MSTVWDASCVDIEAISIAKGFAGNSLPSFEKLLDFYLYELDIFCVGFAVGFLFFSCI